MIIDKRNEFASATALNTGGAGTYNVGNVIDLSVPHDLGGDGALYLVIQADTTITAGASGTVAFQLVSDAGSALETDGSQTVHFSRGTRTVGDGIPAGRVLAAVQLPMEGSKPYERFIGIQQVTGTAAVTAGKINAFLTPDVARWKAYDSPSQV